MQMLVMGDPQITLGGIWSKTIFLRILGCLTWPFFDPHKYATFADVGHGSPTNDLPGHVKQIKFCLAHFGIFLPPPNMQISLIYAGIPFLALMNCFATRRGYAIPNFSFIRLRCSCRHRSCHTL